MNILFVISSEDKGAGGHYNSLFQVSTEVAKKYKVKIILLGKGNSPIVKSSPYFEGQFKIDHSIKECVKLDRSLKKLFINFPPDIIHCFDTNSLNRILLTKSSWKIPIVLNKCGGKNPLRNNHQHAHAIVVFSKENQDWFHSSKNYNNEAIFLIPNRVRELKLLPPSHQIEKSSADKLTFVRVSRLGGAYEFTLSQTYNLLDILSKKIKVELFVVGRVQDANRFKILKEIGEDKPYKVNFITDERAFRGSDFLYLADYVVGTGRSFMEATSLGIPSLTPAQNTDIPILVNKKNVENFLATNFSERNVASNEAQIKTIDSIEQANLEKDNLKQFQKETKEIFEEYFGTDKILKKYDQVYTYIKSSKNSKARLIFRNIPYILKYFINGK